VQINQLTAINKKIILIKSVNINNQKVVSHYSSLTRILSNLLNNAIKFTYPKGIISITTKNLQSKFLHQQKARSVVKISIIDTGIGISKQDNKNIFNRFSRGNKKTHLITGSGLGLPIVKEILSKDNQRLNLLSHMKKGSQASFTLNAIK
jgi:signal transduction histidine kinase